MVRMRRKTKQCICIYASVVFGIFLLSNLLGISSHIAILLDEPAGRNCPLEDILRGQVLRLQQAEGACHAQPPYRNYGNKTLHPRTFIVDLEHRIVFCLVAKIGSTSWTTLFLDKLGHHNVLPDDTIHLIANGTSPLRYLSNLNATLRTRVLREYYSIVYGRNPWRRLLSGYRDKFADVPDRKRIHEKVGRQIIKRYRPNATSHALEHGNDVTFPEFVSWIVELITYGFQLDIHWRSVNELCRLCQHRYSFIGHLEDLESERQLLLPLAFHDLNTSIPEVHRKKLSDDDKDLRDAYIQIPKEHMEALLTYYEVDFEFFGYSKQIPE